MKDDHQGIIVARIVFPLKLSTVYKTVKKRKKKPQIKTAARQQEYSEWQSGVMFYNENHA